MKLTAFDLISFLLFFFLMGGNFLVAAVSWLLFTLLLKPDDWVF